VKALRLNGWKQNAELCEVPVPEPRSGQVLVRIGGAGACHSDLHLMHEIDNWPVALPFTIGHENAGWVEAIGTGVEGVTIGEAVAVYGPWGCGRCRSCQTGFENYCERQSGGAGLGNDGGMASHMVVPSSRYLVPLGDLDPVQAAPLTDAGLTPYSAIKRSLNLLGPGSSTVVIGCGGLGHIAVQILRALSPSRIIAVDPRDDARILATEMGAHHAIAAGRDAAAEVRDLTSARGADLVLDFVAKDDSLAFGASVLAQRGQLTVVGADHGTVPVGFWGMPFGISVSTHSWGALPELTELIMLANSGQVHVKVQEFSLDDAMNAYERVGAGSVAGRAVVVPGT
jgi:alcohol dehydrogenase, propanol-preferring